MLDRRGRTPSAPIPDAYGVGLEVADLLGWLATLEEPAAPEPAAVIEAGLSD